jgi:predicted O-methyltransferase YrrM
MEHIYHLPNFGEQWFDYSDLYLSFIHKLTDGSHIIEVGSWKGKSAAFLAVEIINSKKNIKFDCIDTWLGEESYYQEDEHVKQKKLYELFLSNIEPVKHVIRPIRLTSAAASKLYQDGSIDIIFIDACHDYESVKEDILYWLPKVKTNGILAGHDYKWLGVQTAVHELLDRKNIVSASQCWVYEKTETD